MKTARWTVTVLVVILLAEAGCRKAEQQPGPTPVYYGVKVDLPKLDTEFTNASQEVLATVASVKQLLRSAQLPKALAELGKLAGNPALTETQKKVVYDLTEQTKQVIANSTPSRAQ